MSEITLFSDYALDWLDEKSGIEKSTWENYENVVKIHIVPYFKPKKIEIDAIRPKHIKDYYKYKLTKGRKDNKSGGLSYETLKKHASVLKLIFASALELEEISNNPAEKVSIPKPAVEDQHNSLDDAVFLNADDANRVLDGFQGDILQPLILVALCYGLRRSEILGLKRNAIDFEENTLEIKHTVVKHKTIVAKDRTKSKTSRGVFVLLPEIKDVLLKLIAEQEKNKKLFGKDYIESEYIFTWPNGKQFRPDYLTKRFQTVLNETGLPHMRFHDLRHSCASILYDKGWNVKDIQEWLRHSKLETTMNIYTHISEQRKKILAKDMEGTFRNCNVAGINNHQHPISHRRSNALQVC